MAIWCCLTVGIFYNHLVHFVFIRCIFSGVGITDKEKSGNPALEMKTGSNLFWEEFLELTSLLRNSLSFATYVRR
jgi:hypothetical protein